MYPLAETKIRTHNSITNMPCSGKRYNESCVNCEVHTKDIMRVIASIQVLKLETLLKSGLKTRMPLTQVYVAVASGHIAPKPSSVEDFNMCWPFPVNSIPYPSPPESKLCQWLKDGHIYSIYTFNTFYIHDQKPQEQKNRSYYFFKP